MSALRHASAQPGLVYSTLVPRPMREFCQVRVVDPQLSLYPGDTPLSTGVTHKTWHVVYAGTQPAVYRSYYKVQILDKKWRKSQLLASGIQADQLYAGLSLPSSAFRDLATMSTNPLGSWIKTLCILHDALLATMLGSTTAFREKSYRTRYIRCELKRPWPVAIIGELAGLESDEW
ncbi:hypothetical protein BDZ89DRAFT_1149643 [Hymenopellis radicata]|nr:hypothetical protein BDZ89DRAFT_1149643 [Hymenopellis radicata]